jgi:hypothetical protein
MDCGSNNTKMSSAFGSATYVPESRRKDCRWKLGSHRGVFCCFLFVVFVSLVFVIGVSGFAGFRSLFTYNSEGIRSVTTVWVFAATASDSSPVRLFILGKWWTTTYWLSRSTAHRLYLITHIPFQTAPPTMITWTAQMTHSSTIAQCACDGNTRFSLAQFLVNFEASLLSSLQEHNIYGVFILHTALFQVTLLSSPTDSVVY